MSCNFRLLTHSIDILVLMSSLYVGQSRAASVAHFHMPEEKVKEGTSRTAAAFTMPTRLTQQIGVLRPFQNGYSHTCNSVLAPPPPSMHPCISRRQCYIVTVSHIGLSPAVFLVSLHCCFLKLTAGIVLSLNKVIFTAVWTKNLKNLRKAGPLVFLYMYYFWMAQYLRIRRPLLLASMVRQGDPSWKAALAAFTAKSTSALQGQSKVTVSRNLTFVVLSICHNKIKLTKLKIFANFCRYTFRGLHLFLLRYMFWRRLCQRPILVY